jgi:hypothetical protein
MAVVTLMVAPVVARGGRGIATSSLGPHRQRRALFSAFQAVLSGVRNKVHILEQNESARKGFTPRVWHVGADARCHELEVARSQKRLD